MPPIFTLNPIRIFFSQLVISLFSLDDRFHLPLHLFEAYYHKSTDSLYLVYGLKYGYNSAHSIFTSPFNLGMNNIKWYIEPTNSNVKSIIFYFLIRDYEFRLAFIDKTQTNTNLRTFFFNERVA